MLDASKLTVNANIKGELRIRAIAGTSAVESTSLSGDSLAHEVQWNSNASLQSLKGKPIQLEFVMKDARLYGLELMA
jgi:hypothetical protein